MAADHSSTSSGSVLGAHTSLQGRLRTAAFIDYAKRRLRGIGAHTAAAVAAFVCMVSACLHAATPRHGRPAFVVRWLRFIRWRCSNIIYAPRPPDSYYACSSNTTYFIKYSALARRRQSKECFQWKIQQHVGLQGAPKNRTCLSVDNSAVVNGRKTSDTSKVLEYCKE